MKIYKEQKHAMLLNISEVDLITREFVVRSFLEAPFQTSEDKFGGECKKLQKVKRM